MVFGRLRTLEGKQQRGDALALVSVRFPSDRTYNEAKTVNKVTLISLAYPRTR